MRIKFGQNLWHRFFYEIGHVNSVYILVIYNSQQRIQLVGRAVDDTQAVAGEMLGIKCADKNPENHADCYDDRCET